jgi:hypothetical protein
MAKKRVARKVAWNSKQTAVRNPGPGTPPKAPGRRRTGPGMPPKAPGKPKFKSITKMPKPR